VSSDGPLIAIKISDGYEPGPACGRPAGSISLIALQGLPGLLSIAPKSRRLMRLPPKGGLNQRERMKVDSLKRISESRNAFENAKATGDPDQGPDEHLAPDLGPGAFINQSGDIGFVQPEIAQLANRQSCASARARMTPLMPPADAPAITSTTTRNSTSRPISLNKSK